MERFLFVTTLLFSILRLCVSLTYYEILQVHQNTKVAEIKRAYHKLALQYHPDKASVADREFANREFASIKEAYETLSSPELRRQYDDELNAKEYRFEFPQFDPIVFVIAIAILMVLAFIMLNDYLKDIALDREFQCLEEDDSEINSIPQEQNDSHIQVKRMSDVDYSYIIETQPLMKPKDLFEYKERKLVRMILESNPIKKTKMTSKRSRMIVCHDMKGNYTLSDRMISGCGGPISSSEMDPFTLLNWSIVDNFIYFSHHLVSIPPISWIILCKRHGVPIMGTFLTEWDEGKSMCDELFSDAETAKRTAMQLALIAEDYCLDGWLINIENQLYPMKIEKQFADNEFSSGKVEHVILFLSILTHLMKDICVRRGQSEDESYILWYDSVTIEGRLQWQDKLTFLNKPFFDVCDGILINYTWKEDDPIYCANYVGERCYDIYMGCDVWGRGTYGGGKLNSYQAAQVCIRAGTSLGLFAPGWTLESLPVSCEAESAGQSYSKNYIFFNRLHQHYKLTNQLWDSLEAGWTMTQRSQSRLQRKKILQLSLCRAGLIHNRNHCVLPVVSIFSLPVGIGVYINGYCQPHWTAYTKTNKYKNHVEIKNNLNSIDGTIDNFTFYDLVLQDTMHWLPSIIGRFYSSYEKIGVASGIGVMNIFDNVLSTTSSNKLGVTVNFSTASGFEGTGCLCFYGRLYLGHSATIRISSYKSSFKNKYFHSKESRVDLLGQKGYTSISNYLRYNCPKLVKSGNYIRASIANSGSDNCIIILQILFANDGHSRGDKISSIRLVGKCMGERKRNDTIEPCLTRKTGELFTSCHSSNDDNHVNVNKRQWEEYEWYLDSNILKKLTSLRCIGIEIVCKSRDADQDINILSNSVDLGGCNCDDRMRSVVVHFYLGHIVLGCSISRYDLAQRKYYLEARFESNSKVMAWMSNINSYSQIIISWTNLNLYQITTSYIRDVKSNHEKLIEIGQVLLYIYVNDNWILAGMSHNDTASIAVMCIPSEVKRKFIKVRFLPRSKCYVGVDEESAPVREIEIIQ
jgi:hypothetical protein